MEEIYVNAEYFRSDKPIPSTINPTGPRSSKRSFHSGVILSLGLLSVFLMIGLVTIGIYLHDSTASLSATSSRLSSMTEERDDLKANLSTVTEERDDLKANLSTMSSKLSSMTEEKDHLKASLSTMSSKLSSMTEERDDLKGSLSTMSSKLSSMTEERDDLKGSLSTMSSKLSSMTEERDDLKGSLSTMSSKLSSMTEERNHLHDRLTEKTKELERLQSLLKHCKSCPAGWRMFSCSCYLLSESSGSWDAARKDCRDREADLVVIDSPEEQTFLATFTQSNTWIGLNDKEQEGQWKWVDGTPLTLKNWATNEPNNQGAEGEGGEDCAHLRAADRRTWNDLPCSLSLKWICEKTP